MLSLPDRSRNGAALDVLGRHATGRAGASPVFAELHEADWALELARLALGSHPIDLLVAAAPQAGLEAARTVLGSLLDLPENEFEPLLGAPPAAP